LALLSNVFGGGDFTNKNYKESNLIIS
jgi:hypothetical protein